MSWPCIWNSRAAARSMADIFADRTRPGRPSGGLWSRAPVRRDPGEPMADLDDIRFKIAATRRMLYREGCDSNVGGHVSARAIGEDAFYATGFEYFDQTTPARVPKLDLELRVLEGEMPFSPALNFHARIYQLRPDVNAVVHLHSHHLSVLSSIEGRTIGMYNVVSVLFHEDQATFFDDGHIPHVQVAHALGDKRLLLYKNHGAIIASQSIESATIEAMSAEQAARYHL